MLSLPATQACCSKAAAEGLAILAVWEFNLSNLGKVKEMSNKIQQEKYLKILKGFFLVNQGEAVKDVAIVRRRKQKLYSWHSPEAKSTLIGV